MSKPAHKPFQLAESLRQVLCKSPLAEKDPIKRFEIQQQARIDRWRRETKYGSWVVWPWWAVGWCVGFVVRMIQGLWWNVVNGYKRQTTHWTDGWDDEA